MAATPVQSQQEIQVLLDEFKLIAVFGTRLDSLCRLSEATQNWEYYKWVDLRVLKVELLAPLNQSITNRKIPMVTFSDAYGHLRKIFRGSKTAYLYIGYAKTESLVIAYLDERRSDNNMICVWMRGQALTLPGIGNYEFDDDTMCHETGQLLQGHALRRKGNAIVAGANINTTEEDEYERFQEANQERVHRVASKLSREGEAIQICAIDDTCLEVYQTRDIMTHSDEELKTNLAENRKVLPWQPSIILKKFLSLSETNKLTEGIPTSYRRVWTQEQLNTVLSSYVNYFGFNTSQEKALQMSLNEGLSAVQGPPGTGKTSTSACVAVFHAVVFGTTVVLVAPKNVAVDESFLKVVEIIENHMFAIWVHDHKVPLMNICRHFSAMHLIVPPSCRDRRIYQYSSLSERGRMVRVHMTYQPRHPCYTAKFDNGRHMECLGSSVLWFDVKGVHVTGLEIDERQLSKSASRSLTSLANIKEAQFIVDLGAHLCSEMADVRVQLNEIVIVSFYRGLIRQELNSNVQNKDWLNRNNGRQLSGFFAKHTTLACWAQRQPKVQCWIYTSKKNDAYCGNSNITLTESEQEYIARLGKELKNLTVPADSLRMFKIEECQHTGQICTC